MVSFWPWKGDDSSPAAFEKGLSAIAKKIGAANTSLESSRQQSRRYKALWTLYTSIAYLLYSMIIGLVIGFKNTGMLELAGLIGGPLAIYGVRQAITSIYAYRISRQQAYLESLQKQRDGIIKKLKDATKYDSTQQLLEKYGGTPARPKKAPSNKNSTRDQPKPGRTMVIPPPTANIPRGPMSAPHPAPEHLPPTPQSSLPPLTAAAATPPWQQPIPETEEFAPNAFTPPSNHYASGSENTGPQWYDRIMDVLLGEDENHPKNRIVLICQKCRLINGQAPPGIKTLADIGKWKCSACGSLNGEESEVQKVVQEIQAKREEVEDDEEEAVLVEIVERDSGDEGRPVSSSKQSAGAKARKGRVYEE